MFLRESRSPKPRQNRTAHEFHLSCSPHHLRCSSHYFLLLDLSQDQPARRRRTADRSIRRHHWCVIRPGYICTWRLWSDWSSSYRSWRHHFLQEASVVGTVTPASLPMNETPSEEGI